MLQRTFTHFLTKRRSELFTQLAKSLGTLSALQPAKIGDIACTVLRASFSVRRSDWSQSRGRTGRDLALIFAMVEMNGEGEVDSWDQKERSYFHQNQKSYIISRFIFLPPRASLNAPNWPTFQTSTRGTVYHKERNICDFYCIDWETGC